MLFTLKSMGVARSDSRVIANFDPDGNQKGQAQTDLPSSTRTNTIADIHARDERTRARNWPEIVPKLSFRENIGKITRNGTTDRTVNVYMSEGDHNHKGQCEYDVNNIIPYK